MMMSILYFAYRYISVVSNSILVPALTRNGDYQSDAVSVTATQADCASHAYFEPTMYLRPHRIAHITQASTKEAIKRHQRGTTRCTSRTALVCASLLIPHVTHKQAYNGRYWSPLIDRSS